MDPYVIVEYKKKTYKSQVKKEAGKKPHWGFRTQLFVDSLNDEIKIKVMDEDTLKDDKVGDIVCSIRSIVDDDDEEHTKWVDITYNKNTKSAGKVFIKTKFDWPPGSAPALKKAEAIRQK